MELSSTLAEHARPQKTAVLVIDLQNDTCDPAGVVATVHHSDISSNQAILEPVAAFLGAAREAAVRVIYIKTVVGTWTLSRSARTKFGVLGTGENQVPRVPLCKEGSWGAEVHPAVAPELADLVVEKYWYSAFHDTPLELALRSEGIETVVAVGTAANVCVESTVREAFFRDFNVIVAADLVGTRGEDREFVQASLTTIGRYFGLVCSSADLLAAWNAAEDRDGTELGDAPSRAVPVCEQLTSARGPKGRHR